MNKTDVEWCFDASGKVSGGYTWNLYRGCSKDDIDCDNCYAMRIAARFSYAGGAFEGFAKMGKRGPRWTGKLALLGDKVTEPMRCRDDGAWIFANSTSDMFHPNLADDEIDWGMTSMLLSTHMKFVVLTKRTHRAARYFAAAGVQDRWHRCAEALRKEVKGYNGISIPPPDQLPAHIWLGMSAGNQETFDKRIGGLLEMPGRHLLSLEPLLGELDIAKGLWRGALGRTRVEWVITGGESGPNRRPAEVPWVRSIRDQCLDRGDVTFFLKQWALADGTGVVVDRSNRRVGIESSHPHTRTASTILSVPLLDGVQWNQPPRTFSTDGVN